MPIVPGSDAGVVWAAAVRLAAGELVAFPTETVYGLGARADDDAAVARIFAAKGASQATAPPCSTRRRAGSQSSWMLGLDERLLSSIFDKSLAMARL